MKFVDSDASVWQFERDAAIACGVMAAASLIVSRGRPDVAAGVIAGGALTGVSYLAIKGAVNLVTGVARQAASPDAESAGDRALSTGSRVALGVKFFTRYALLAVGAYVMLACFRVHPVGLFIGATTPFAAAAVQAVRASRATSRREHP